VKIENCKVREVRTGSGSDRAPSKRVCEICPVATAPGSDFYRCRYRLLGTGSR